MKLEERPEQIEIANKIAGLLKTKDNIFLEAPTGCHAKGTEILMRNGTLKLVEDIQVGDILMGPGSSPREVLELHSGEQVMYEVTPIKGEPFIVNKDHILSLLRTNDGTKLTNSIINISIKDYLEKSKTFKHIHKLYRVPVSFSKNKLKVPPYILSILLGDGRNRGTDITNSDKPVIQAWGDYAKEIGLRITTNKLSLNMNRGREAKKKNFLLDFLREYNLIHNKHIPHEYKTSSKQDRLELLAGLIDTDGHLCRNCFEIISKYDQLAKDIIFVARSLGFSATSSIKWVQLEGWDEPKPYHRINISGNVDTIPTRVTRKQASPRKQIKNVLRTGFTLQKLKKDQYYGFTVDEDHLYLMGDFIVTHNSGKSGCAYFAHEKGELKKTIILCHQKILQDQYHKLFDGIEGIAVIKGKENYQCTRYQNTKVSDAPCQVFQGTNTHFACAKDCEYFTKRGKLATANIVVTNYQLILSLINAGSLPTRWDMAVYDECHKIEEIFTNYIKVSIGTADQTAYYNIMQKEASSFLSEYLHRGTEHIVNFDVNDWEGSFTRFNVNRSKMIEVLEKYFTRGFSSQNMEKVSFDDLALSRFLTREKRECQKYLNYLNTKDKVKYIYESAKRKDFKAFEITPLNIDFIFGNIANSISDKKLFMSSTILDYKDYLETLGISESSQLISVPSNFPVQNRKILIKPVVYLSFKNIGHEKTETLKLVQSIKAICKHHKNESGVIFASSYSFAYMLRDLLIKEIDHTILVNRDSTERNDIIKRFREGKGNNLLISPSFFEGINFEDDISRFQIVAKAPYMSLASKYVSAKAKQSRKWYELHTLKSIIQACGRSVRHKEDYATTYCLDGHIYKLYVKYQDLMPTWFNDAVVLLKNQ